MTYTRTPPPFPATMDGKIHLGAQAHAAQYTKPASQAEANILASALMLTSQILKFTPDTHTIGYAAGVMAANPGECFFCIYDKGFPWQVTQDQQRPLPEPWLFHTCDVSGKNAGDAFLCRMLAGGVNGPAVTVPDASITASGTTLHSLSAAFPPTCVGDWVVIRGAGPVDDLVTSITKYTTSSQVEVAQAATRTVSDAQMLYGPVFNGDWLFNHGYTGTPVTFAAQNGVGGQPYPLSTDNAATTQPRAGVPAITADGPINFHLQDLFADAVSWEYRMGHNPLSDHVFHYIFACFMDITKAGAFSTGASVPIVNGTGAGTTTLHCPPGPFSNAQLSGYLGTKQAHLNTPGGKVAINVSSVTDASHLVLASAIPSDWDGSGTVNTIPWNPDTGGPMTWQQWAAKAQAMMTAVGTALGAHGSNNGIVTFRPGLSNFPNVANNSSQWYNDPADNPGAQSSVIPGEGVTAAQAHQGDPAGFNVGVDASAAHPEQNLYKSADIIWCEAWQRPIANNAFDPRAAFGPASGQMLSDAQFAVDCQRDGCWFNSKTRLTGTAGPTYTDSTGTYLGFKTSLRGTNPNYWDQWRAKLAALALICDQGKFVLEVSNDDGDANPITDLSSKIWKVNIGAPLDTPSASILDYLLTTSGTVHAAATNGKTLVRRFASGIAIASASDETGSGDGYLHLTLGGTYKDATDDTIIGSTLLLPVGAGIVLAAAAAIGELMIYHDPGGGILIGTPM